MVADTPNIFVSYSRADSDMARRIVSDLRNLGANPWFDVENLTPGENWEESIRTAIGEAGTLVVLTSEDSLRSQSVSAEFQEAFSSPGTRVIPVLFDGAKFDDLPPGLKRVQGVDLDEDYAGGLRAIVESARKLEVAGAPSVAEGIDVEKLSDEIVKRILSKMGSTDAATPLVAPAADVDSELVFVIISFRPDMEPAFEAIEAAARHHGLRAERVKDVVGDYRITEKMLAMIEKARFVVADLTHERPNVYFELGYARGIGKKIVTILREGTERHFDVYDWNYISYADSRPLERALRDRFAHEAAP